MENKRVFAIVYDNFCIGGIQTYFYKAAKLLLDKEYKIITVRNQRIPIDEAFKGVFCSDKIQDISIDDFDKSLITYVRQDNCKLTIWTYRVIDMAYAQRVRNAFPLGQVDVFYSVANFTGLDYYYEDVFKGRKKSNIQKKLSSIFELLNKNGQIRHFSLSHIDEMTKRYNLNFADYNKVFVPSLNITRDLFDEQRCRKLYHSETFKILTISRFDFPHKGFIIGLIQEYGRLKKKYPQLTYTLVGYGPGLGKINDAISSLSPEAQKDISLKGKCTPEEMANYYHNANLNISVAGCCSQGAFNGCLSLPTRHFTYDCEVYGYLPGSNQMNTSDAPGEPVAKYIEEIINMDEETYVSKCRDSYNGFDFNRSYTDILDTNINESYIPVEHINYLIKLQKIVKNRNWWQTHISTIKAEGFRYPFKALMRRIRK